MSDKILRVIKEVLLAIVYILLFLALILPNSLSWWLPNL